MKVAETSPCDTCKHTPVCVFLKEYKKIKNEIEAIPIDSDFLKPINPSCKYFEERVCSTFLR